MTKKYLIAALAIALFGGGLFLGYRLFAPRPLSKTVNAQVVLTALKSEGFLVTQSYVFNQVVTINHSTGSQFKDIFWKQAIKASANVKVNSGVNLTKIAADNITVSGKTITLELPAIETNSTEIIGDVILQNNQGILKKVFDSNDGYNESITEIKNQALLAATGTELRAAAEESAQKEIQRLIRYAYPESEVLVQFKEVAN